MSGLWEMAVELFNLHFISLRENDKSDQITGDVSWESMENLVSAYGIGVSDAMILNMFLSSSFSTIISTDSDLVYVLSRIESQDKIVIAPKLLT